jgi:hypothetical protein
MVLRSLTVGLSPGGLSFFALTHHNHHGKAWKSFPA